MKRRVIGNSRAILYRSLVLPIGRILSVALICLFFTPLTQARPLHVTIVTSEDGGAYDVFTEALRNKLEASRFVWSIKRVGDALTESDLYIAVGMKAASELTSQTSPVFNVFIPKAGYDKLPRDSIARVSSRSTIYLDQPIERQLFLLRAVLPKVKHVGVLYATPPAGISTLRRMAIENNLVLHEKTVGQEQVLSDALEEVLEVSEVLLAVPDTNVYNAGTIRNILLTSYRKQIPLIGISQAYVKAGALCAIYSSPVQIATQAAEAVKQFSESGKLPPNQYAKEFEISVNTQVARSLNLIIKDADELRNEIRRNP